MCAIAGFAGFKDEALLKRMADIQAHRGPDGEGFYSDHLVGLAHRRLSIIGVESGSQPLYSEDGNVVLVCNGEIYNYRELRQELRRQGHSFATESDSEVIVHLYEALGAACVERLEGMFAFALWDRKAKTLLLARDRMGIKPLCYARRGGSLSFASEVKALFLWDELPRQVNVGALDSWLGYKFIPGEETLFQGVQRLAPGSYLIFEPETGGQRQEKFWDPAPALPAAVPAVQDCGRRLISILDEAVQSHMVSDVPVGATLSGGLDSSLIVALMSRYTSPVKTYSIGFGDGSDELHFARDVARHFKTDHHEWVQQPETLFDVLPDLLWHAEEPIAGALLPTYFLGRRIGSELKVALVGEGSDELFGGYVRYKTLVPPFSWLGPTFNSWTYRRGLNAATRREKCRLYEKSFSGRLGGLRRPDPFIQALRAPGRDVLNKALLFEQKNELPNYQLSRVDRLTMAFGLEARVPFLDRRVVEFANALPSWMKVRRFDEKHILKIAARGVLPENILRRRKQGLSSPIGSWFDKGLSRIASEYLSEARLKRRGYFRSDPVKELMRSGGRKSLLSSPAFKVNALMMLELWHEIFIDPPAWPPKKTSAGPGVPAIMGRRA